MKSVLTQILIFILASALIFGLYASRPLIWIAAVIILIALVTLSKYLWSKSYSKYGQLVNSSLEKLKSSGQRIKVEFEHCDFKESSYTSEIIDERSTRYGQLNLDYGEVIGHEFTAQSLLIYHHRERDQVEIFRQGFPCSADALRLYVLNNSVELYVDRTNRTRYFFDLKKS